MPLGLPGDPVIYRVKIVPNDNPNADGRWIEVCVDRIHTTRWNRAESRLYRHIPDDHHMVSYEEKK